MKLLRRVILLLLMGTLPLFGIAAASTGVCHTGQQELVGVADTQASSQSEASCAHHPSAQDTCESETACSSSCIPPMADASQAAESGFLQSASLGGSVSHPPSRTVGVLERPPMSR